MSESGDFTPAHWSGGAHRFDSAYKAYDAHAGRSYSDAKAASKKLADLLPPKLSTKSASPLVIVTDQTGSMGDWPKTMFSKLPYLELEGQEYLGMDMEIAWCAIGDAMHSNEDYPAQARPFTKGIALKDRLKELVIEGKGGGGGNETYEIMALYLANNVEMPNALRPICIFIGDEMPYDTISPDMAKTFAYVNIEKRMTTAAVFDALKAKFATYLIRKTYEDGSGDSMSAMDKQVHGVWSKLLGADHICDLPDPNRVVDVIFGILAKETGRIPYFRDELEARQLPDKGGKGKVDTVYKSLKTVHRLAKPSDSGKASGHSKTHGIGGGTPTKPLA